MDQLFSRLSPRQFTVQEDVARNVQVYAASLDLPRAQVIQLSLLLSPGEMARAAGEQTEALRWRFMAGRGLLRLILAKLTGKDASRVELEYSRSGKPVLFQPSHARKLYFSLSYSDHVALYAFSYDKPVGVDLAAVRPVDSLDSKAADYFSEEERAALMKLPPAHRHTAFHRLWTLKEAYLKARDVGFCHPLQQISVSLGQPPRLLRSLFDRNEVSRWLFEVMEPVNGYVGALAVGG